MQPIYLNFKLRHGTGKDEQLDESDSKLGGDETSTAPEKPTLKKVISINGEEVEISPDLLDDINIHDYATFEREQHITSKFMRTIRRKSSDAGPGVPVNKDKPLLKTPSFKLIARDVMRVENVLLALKHYSHRSDSEPETDEEILENDSSDQDNAKAPARTIDIWLENNNEESLASKERLSSTRLPTLSEQDHRLSQSSEQNPRLSRVSAVANTETESPKDHREPIKTETVSPEREVNGNHNKALKSPSVTSSLSKTSTGELTTPDGVSHSPVDGSRKLAPDSPSVVSYSATSTSYTSDDGTDVSLLREKPGAETRPRTNPPARRLSQVRASKRETGCDSCCVML